MLCCVRNKPKVLYLYRLFITLLYNLSKFIQMAVIKSGILGGLSGSIGNVTGSSWKGIPVLRTKPLSVANPNTPAQQAVRTPWAKITVLGSSIVGSIIQPVWNGLASKMSGYNLFLQQNSQSAFSALGDFVPANLTVSPGTLASTPITSNNLDDLSSAPVTWSAVLPSPQALATDRAYIAVFDSNGLLAGVSSGLVPRSAGTATITFIKQLVNGDHCAAYLFFMSADGKRIFAQSHKALIANG